MTELVRGPLHITHALVNTQERSTLVNFPAIIDPKNYSSLTRLLRISAYVLRFINKLKSNPSHSASKPVKKLSASEINEAETYWTKSVQANDKGVLRYKGRLNNADIPTTSKNPILLPSKNDFVSLLIKDVHVKVKHNGVRDTLTTLRENYWVLRGREATKRIVKECVICRKFEGVPFKPQSSPDLPDMRVADASPFTCKGVDFAGPLYITSPRDPQSNESVSEKVYICLFTCASTCAVHLELTRDLGVNSFLQAFRRFSSRRGLPSTLISDNAKTFKASSKEIEKLVRSPEVQCYLSNSPNDSTSRAFWKLGKVEQLIPGKDGKVRAAIVKVSSSNGKNQLLKRVIQHLIPIEVRSESNIPMPRPQSTPLQEPQPAGHINSVGQRPRRNAAIQGELLRRELLNI
ncbi:uncharacterized protein [Montipora capricornis]|uniref:uncharacterized protein n=1 Tax=Montipora capricornis TaxID=246305 RepID=UPI0035F1D9E9